MTAPNQGYAVRERNFRQALDLGLLLYRQIALPLLVLASPILASLAILALVVLPVDRAWLVGIVAWLVKPAWDRLSIAMASLVFLEPEAKPAKLFAKAKLLLSWRLLWELGPGRWSWTRAFTLPVTILEGLRGKERKARRAALLRDQGGMVLGFGALMALTTTFLWSLIALGVVLILPDTASGSPLITRLLVLAWVLALFVSHGIHGVGCFALYINHRTISEAWDLRVALRRIPQQRSVALALGLVFLASLVAPVPARAETMEPGLAESLERVLQGPEFGYSETRTGLKFRNRQTETSPLDLRLPKNLGASVAGALRILVWITVAALAILLVWWVRRRIPDLRAQKAPPVPTRMVAGTGLPQSPLPEDPDLRKIRGLLDRGEVRPALAMLLALALRQARVRYDVEVPSWATDDQALDLVVRSSRVEAGFLAAFTALASLWTQVAWAGLEPAPSDLEHILQHFDQEGAPS